MNSFATKDDVICDGVESLKGTVIRVSRTGKYHGYIGWADVRWHGYITEAVGKNFVRVSKSWSKRMPLKILGS